MQPASPHAQTERAFHAALWTAAPPAGITAPDLAEVAERFKVYRNNVQFGLTRTLAVRFPVIAQLVGAEFFAAMARVFIAQSPPQNPVLLHWGADFAAFLQDFPPVAHLPYLGCVARLEYARGLACHAADADPIPPEALTHVGPERLRLVLHPSVALFHAAFPAVQIWLAHQPGHAGTPIGPGPDHALIGRAPDFTLIVARIDPGTHAVLAALQAGQTLGQAATLSDPAEALSLLLRHGLIITTLSG